MIDLEVATNDDERLALRILLALEDGDLATRIPELCSEDFVWANSGLPTLHGRREIEAHMQGGGFAQHVPILAEMTHFSVDLLHMASRAGVVFTERVDHHWRSDGADLMTPHICGIMEIRDGRIAALRDFYDVACYQQEPTKPDPAFALQAFRERTRQRATQ